MGSFTHDSESKTTMGIRVYPDCERILEERACYSRIEDIRLLRVIVRQENQRNASDLEGHQFSGGSRLSSIHLQTRVEDNCSAPRK